MKIDSSIMSRPIGFFIHHQGRGHMKRCLAIIEMLGDVPVHIFCAKTDEFSGCSPNITVYKIPNFHGETSRTDALHRQSNCEALDCAPLGVDALRKGMGSISTWMSTHDPLILVVDVSSEVSVLARICSVPTITLRMHGDRNDQAHRAAYSGSSGILAPFDERIEQDDWPEIFGKKTCYVGGLLSMPSKVLDRGDARTKLGLDQSVEVIVVLSGGGGAGANLASLTIGARAKPDALWIVLGEVHHHGHETSFWNLKCLGWISNPLDYVSAADTVIATPGDTVVHEVALVGRPLICIPEWCYYGEQARKAIALENMGVAIHSPEWPSDFSSWQQLLQMVRHCDLDLQRTLTCPEAAMNSAEYILGLANGLWAEEIDSPH